MIIYCDLDGVLMTQDPENKADYINAKPIQANIDKLNKLYDDGHTIVIWTARGSTSQIDSTELTKSQLKDFGIKYHNLKPGKPFWDIFIDDRTFNSFEEYEKSR